MSDLPENEFAAEPSPVEAAVQRLNAALDALESAVEARQEHDRGQDNLETRIQALGADRSRLAHELDGSLARAQSLEGANRDVAERLDHAIETIRSVLKGQDLP
jgi:hypothetical protein